MLVGGRRCRLDDVLGPTAAEIQAADELLVRRADGTVVAIEDPAGVLRPWMGSAARVVVRPDRIVRAAAPR